MKNFFRSLYLNNPLFLGTGLIVLLFIFSYFFPLLLGVSKVALLVLVLLLLLDILALYRGTDMLKGERHSPDRLSNGDDNEIVISLENNYAFKARIKIIDEIPFQFQKRDFSMQTELMPGKSEKLRYLLHPLKRGEYAFGRMNVYVRGPLRLASRRYIFSENKIVPVYPSFLQMRKYQLYAISNRLVMEGIKKIRKFGHNMEFEQIREYVLGDDVRGLNWKATARKGEFMVNQYQDEKAQQVYSLIDKGRVMKIPFEGMTLLDYAINAGLVISDIALKKDDKAGLIIFSNQVASFLPAEKRSRHINKILNLLYKEKTAYLESDYGALYANIKRRITQRSLLLLFTNFESLSSMRRQLPYLKSIARDHLLVVIFFRNTELKKLLDNKAENTEEVYIKAIAEKFDLEKRQIVKELQQQGIYSILTRPADLTVNTINKYLELKARGQI